MKIDWMSDQSIVLANPRMPQHEYGTFGGSPSLPGHIWVGTSGSSGVVKWVGLSKQAILASAEAVNRFLSCVLSDVWINPLPIFHVGGLGIYARSFLTQCKCVAFEEKWQPDAFVAKITEHHGTLTSLVPTQVYDLVVNQLTAPASLRAVLVGGGRLEEEIYVKARELGWPLLPSYGLTECASGVATASLQTLNEGHYPSLTLLPHVQAKHDEGQRIWLKSPALLSMYAMATGDGLNYCDPKQDGWLQTEDLGEVAGDRVVIKGRGIDFLKIGGESVSFARLVSLFDTLRCQVAYAKDAVLFPMPDERLGHVIHVAVDHEPDQALHSLIEMFNAKVFPFERIRRIKVVNKIPRSPLHKVLLQEVILC